MNFMLLICLLPSGVLFIYAVGEADFGFRYRNQSLYFGAVTVGIDSCDP